MQIDPVVVDALVNRFPVPGAADCDKAEAARILHGKGRPAKWIALVLREELGRVTRWINSPPSNTLCRNGIHEMTEDNIKMHRGHTKCLACHRDWKRRARQRERNKRT